MFRQPQAEHQKNQFANASDALLHVNCSREAISTNVTNGSVISVNRTEVGQHVLMRPLKDVYSANALKVLYVFYDFETILNTRYSDKAKAHVPKLVCVQQICARCEDVEGDVDCLR